MEITFHKGDQGFLVADLFEGPFPRPVVVGVSRSTPTADSIKSFRDAVEDRYPKVRQLQLVYAGPAAPDDVADHAQDHDVWLRPLTGYLRVWDPTGYLVRQRTFLASDPEYRLDRYVDKPWAPVGQLDGSSEDAVAEEVVRALTAPGPRFLLALGDFGTGKTFLLRYLAATLPDRLPDLTPVLVTMRDLQKARTLHELVSQNMARYGQDPFRFAAFEYLLLQGRVVLLVDGFTGTRDRMRAGGAPVRLRHMTATHQIDLIDPATARGRCYYQVLTPVGLDHWGRYVDEYRSVDGAWRFARRRVTVDGRAPDTLFPADPPD